MIGGGFQGPGATCSPLKNRLKGTEKLDGQAALCDMLSECILYSELRVDSVRECF